MQTFDMSYFSEIKSESIILCIMQKWKCLYAPIYEISTKYGVVAKVTRRPIGNLFFNTFAGPSNSHPLPSPEPFSSRPTFTRSRGMDLVVCFPTSSPELVPFFLTLLLPLSHLFSLSFNQLYPLAPSLLSTTVSRSYNSVTLSYSDVDVLAFNRSK